MRKFLVGLLSSASLLLLLSATPVQAACQNINLTDQRGTFTGEVCLTSSSLTLTGAAFVVATGKTYTVEANATISGTPGHYTVSGTVTISDGTTTKTWTFNCGGITTVTASTAFVGEAINNTLSQQPPPPPVTSAVLAPSAD